MEFFYTMKKIIAVITISILSLLNGFTNTINDADYYEMKQNEKDMLPIRMLVTLDDEIRRIPNFIETIAKKKNLALNISRLLESNKKLLDKLERPKETTAWVEEDEGNWELVNANLRDECLKYGVDIPVQTNSEDTEQLAQLYRYQYELVIECLLTAYDRGLLAKAEERLLKLKSEL